MYGLITGITDTDDINYCPKCRSDNLSYYSDGTASRKCGFHFGVVEDDEEWEELNGCS